jgi:TPR repeat protein
MYYLGYGVPEDYTKVIKWYRKAAEQGHAEARSAINVQSITMLLIAMVPCLVLSVILTMILRAR